MIDTLGQVMGMSRCTWFREKTLLVASGITVYYITCHITCYITPHMPSLAV